MHACRSTLEDPTSLALFATSAVGFVVFFFVERAADEHALLPLRMFRVKTVSITTSANFVMGFAMFGGLAGLPLYLQISRGFTPTQAGLAMLPFTAGILTVAIAATIVIRKTGHYKWIPVGGFVLLLVGTLLLSRVEYNMPFGQVVVAALVFGAGLGGIMQPMLLAVQNSLPARDNGAGTASVMFFRQIGGSIGTAVFLSLMFAQVPGHIADAFKARAETPEFQAAIADPEVLANPLNAAVLDIVKSGDIDAAGDAGLSLDDTSFIQELNPELAAPFQIGFAEAIGDVLLISAAFIVIALAIVFFLPSLPLSEKSGLENMHDDGATVKEKKRARAKTPAAAKVPAKVAAKKAPPKRERG